MFLQYRINTAELPLDTSGNDHWLKHNPHSSIILVFFMSVQTVVFTHKSSKYTCCLAFIQQIARLNYYYIINVTYNVHAYNIVHDQKFVP